MVREWTLLLLACAAYAQTGAELYKTQCAGCHGPSGEGSRGPSLKTQRTAGAEALISLLRRGVPGTEMAATPASVISDQSMGALAAYVLAFRTEVVSGVSGRVARGDALFRTRGKCLDCHRLNGEGRPLAPDLSRIGQERDSNWLRRAITDPQADIYDSFAGYRWTIQIPDNYLFVELETVNGEKVSGPRINEDAFSIQLRDKNGKIRSFLRSEIKELQKHWGKSPMPSYNTVFTPSELDDLVAYLASLRSPR
jgi:putative heme-binding domain-containing protein